MSLEWIVGLSVLFTLVLLLGGHFVLHRLIKFKMDESAIVQFLLRSGRTYPEIGAQEIAKQTGLSVQRVQVICSSSKHIVSSGASIDDLGE